MSLLLPSSTAYLRLQAQRRRDNGGLIANQAHLPFGALADGADSAALWLVKRGIGAGDHVGLLAGNSLALVTWQFALWSIGAIAVPISPRATSSEAAACLEHSRSRYLVCDDAQVPLGREAAVIAGIAAATAGVPFKPTVLRRTAAIAAHPPRAPRPGDLAVIAYTSGTTGHAKGVMLTHANLLWSVLSCSSARGDTSNGVALCLSPLTHTPVFVSHLLCRVLAGQTAVLLDRFDVGAVLDAVARFHITDLPLIGGMVFAVTELGKLPQRMRKSVTKVSVGGAATPMDAKRRLAEIFSAAEIIEAYGQSESTDGVAMARGGSVFDKPGTIGCANPHVAVDVLRGDGARAEPTECGEIAISGPTVMAGYFRDRIGTAAAIRDGWLRSGDLGYRDADGFLFITGRAKDLIITGGENVSPLEVEEALRRHPAVADVAVVGLPHPRWGEQVTAAIVRTAGFDTGAEALIEFAGTRLAGFKKPRRIEFLPALPRNAANKVETARLKQLLSRKV